MPSYARPGAFLHRMRPPVRQFVQLDQQVEIDQQKSGKIEINFVQENVNLDEDEKSEDQETEVTDENAELIMQQTDNIQMGEEENEGEQEDSTPEDKKLV